MKKILLIIVLLSIPLVAANSQPIIEDVGIKSVNVGESFSYLVGINDPDGDELSLSTDSKLVKINPLGLIEFIPKESDLGIHRIKIFADDGEIKSQSTMTLVINKNTSVSSVHIFPRTLERYSSKGSTTETISIINDGNEKIFTVAENTITGELKDIEINPKETYSLELSFNIDEPIKTGKIIFHGLENNVDVILAQFSKSPGYGILLNIPAKFRELQPGNNVAADITLSNIEDGKKNISIDYIIKDFDNNVIRQESEFVEILDEKKYTKKMKLPDYIGDGKYLFAIVTKYNDKIISSAETFSIYKIKSESQSGKFIFTTQIIISIIIVVLVLFLLVINYNHISKIETHKVRYAEKIYQRILRKKEEKEDTINSINKLEKQSVLLEKAYKEKLISKESYEKDKKKLKKQLKKFKESLKENDTK